MDDQPVSPVTVKADDQSTSVLFTYFQGDINSVVDEHFSRALNKASRPKDLTSKSKSSRQTPKSEDLIPVQWAYPASSWSEPPYPSTSSGQIQFSMLEDAHTSQRVMTSPSNLWSFAPRPAAGFGMSSVVYPSPGPAEVPGPAERPYANSFLGLLHSDRPGAAASLSSPSKPDLAPGWNPTAGFRDPLESGINLDSGVQVPEKKKDLYWY
nr:transcription cofactor vestigial-like protein 1 [Paramormyrops kingsleyae]